MSRVTIRNSGKLVLAVSAALIALAAARAGIGPVGFEEDEGFHAGVPAESLAGWTLSGGGVVAAGDSGQHLELAGEGAAASRVVAGTEWGSKPIAYYDFRVRPTADSSEQPPVSVTADGAALAFVRVGDRGVVVALDGATGTGVFTDATFAVGTENRANDWMRVTIREDYAQHKWDLYIDGRPVGVNLGMDGNSARPALFSAVAGDGQSLSLDDWRLAEEQLLFADGDGDGMPDDYESANNLNPSVDDRDWDADGDGVTNIEEFRHGSPPQSRGEGHGRMLYVDNRIGSDSNSGALPYASAGAAGPKFSLKAAMAAAQSGDTITVLRGTGFYNEGSRNSAGKALAIKTVGNVSIK